MDDKLQERIIGHFEPEKVRRLEVEEWGEPGKPLVITYMPVTIDDVVTVSELDGMSFDKQCARIVVLKAMDENGKRLFNMADATSLRKRAAPEVVKKIALTMLGRLSQDEAAKN